MRRRSVRFRSWCLSTDRTIPSGFQDAQSLPMFPCTAHRSRLRTLPFPLLPPTRPSLCPSGLLDPLDLWGPLDPWDPLDLWDPLHLWDPLDPLDPWDPLDPLDLWDPLGRWTTPLSRSTTRPAGRWRPLRSCSGRSSGPWCRWPWGTPACPTCPGPPRRWPFPWRAPTTPARRSPSTPRSPRPPSRARRAASSERSGARCAARWAAPRSRPASPSATTEPPPPPPPRPPATPSSPPQARASRSQRLFPRRVGSHKLRPVKAGFSPQWTIRRPLRSPPDLEFPCWNPQCRRIRQTRQIHYQNQL